MTCRELLQALNDHLDGEAGSSLCAEFERHLADCHPCRLVVDTARRTITLYRENRRYQLPAAGRERLRRALKDNWQV